MIGSTLREKKMTDAGLYMNLIITPTLLSPSKFFVQKDTKISMQLDLLNEQQNKM